MKTATIDPRTGAAVRPHEHNFRGPDGSCIAAPGCGAIGTPTPTKIDRAQPAQARCERHAGDPYPTRCDECDAAALDADAAELITCAAHGFQRPCPACSYTDERTTR